MEFWCDHVIANVLRRVVCLGVLLWIYSLELLYHCSRQQKSGKYPLVNTHWFTACKLVILQAPKYIFASAKLNFAWKEWQTLMVRTDFIRKSNQASKSHYIEPHVKQKQVFNSHSFANGQHLKFYCEFFAVYNYNHYEVNQLITVNNTLNQFIKATQCVAWWQET